MNPEIIEKAVIVLNLEHVAQLQIETNPWKIEPPEHVMKFGVSNSAPFMIDLVHVASTVTVPGLERAARF